jgi:aspartyl/asparaginyl beta-hydroxylase (cupin superfamily)
VKVESHHINASYERGSCMVENERYKKKRLLNSDNRLFASLKNIKIIHVGL